ncbi:armadillo-type protein [Cyathus striatus]|nr:armadillo-type protein [Cyathus striatus]
MVNKEVRALLNRLTIQNFDFISDQLIAWVNKSEGEKDGHTLIQVIRLTFEMAILNEATSEMFARLCRKMMEQISSKVQDEGIKNNQGKPIAGGQLFRKYLLNRCQEDFERGWKLNMETGSSSATANAPEDDTTRAVNEASKTVGGGCDTLSPDEDGAYQRTRRQGLGLMKFIGELFKLQMLTERIMHECVKKLLGNIEDPEEEEIESLCKLLTTVGQILDTPKAKAHMDVYFSRMEELSRSNQFRPHIKNTLRDVIELREHKWIASNTFSGSSARYLLPKASDISPFSDVICVQSSTLGKPSSLYAGEKEAVSRSDSSSDIVMTQNQSADAGENQASEALPPLDESCSTFDKEMSAPTLLMNVEEAKRNIPEVSKEFFRVRNLDEAEVYFTSLPEQFHRRLVSKLVSSAIQSNEADARLVADLFSRVVSKKLCSFIAFDDGFNLVAGILHDIVMECSNAFRLFVVMVKGSSRTVKVHVS